MLEGAEPMAFTQWATSWEGGKKTPPYVPKLFQCSDQNGKLSVEEIYNYKQEVNLNCHKLKILVYKRVVAFPEERISLVLLYATVSETCFYVSFMILRQVHI